MSETIKANGVEITVDVTKTTEHSGRELYKMLDDVCSMDSEDLIEEFGVEYFGDIFCEYSYDGFVKAYEQYKKHEAEIRVGDEVEWTSKNYGYNPYRVCEVVSKGIVVSINNFEVNVLTSESLGKHYYLMPVRKDTPSLRKTGFRCSEIAHLMEKK